MRRQDERLEGRLLAAEQARWAYPDRRKWAAVAEALGGAERADGPSCASPSKRPAPRNRAERRSEAQRLARSRRRTAP